MYVLRRLHMHSANRTDLLLSDDGEDLQVQLCDLIDPSTSAARSTEYTSREHSVQCTPENPLADRTDQNRFALPTQLGTRELG